jgi:hypothetical protein
MKSEELKAALGRAFPPETRDAPDEETQRMIDGL